MKEVVCIRAGHSNKTDETYKPGEVYVVDLENPRTVKFFAYPEDDKEAQALKKQHLALFAAEKAGKGKAKKAEPEGDPAAEKAGKGK
jgi:hypothetical protein